MSRLEKLKDMLKDDPTDAFVRYGLAMEYRTEEQYEEAEQIEEAKATLTTGIAQAKAQDNLHAAGEMSEFLASLN